MISVVICAHTERRWDDTLAAIQSVRDQSHPAGEIILVVDHHPELFAAFLAELPDVRVVENQEARGLSGGKNTGVALATGEVVAFLDDDAVAEPDWLKFFVDSYTDPQVIGVGGLTLPRWERARPMWFPPEFDWVVGCNYLGMPNSGEPVRNLLGGNASFRRDAFEKAGGFRNGIGRSASKRPLGCEETEFCIRLTQIDPEAILVIDHRSIIWHWVPEDRCRFRYFLSRCYAEGLSKSMVTSSVGPQDGLASERNYVFRTLSRAVIGGVGRALLGDASAGLRAAAVTAGLAATTVGYLDGSLSASLTRWRRPSGIASAPKQV